MWNWKSSKSNLKVYNPCKTHNTDPFWKQNESIAYRGNPIFFFFLIAFSPDEFVKHEVDIETFKMLTSNDLKQLGVQTFAERKRIIIAINQLKSGKFSGSVAVGAERRPSMGWWPCSCQPTTRGCNNQNSNDFGWSHLSLSRELVYISRLNTILRSILIEIY